MTRSAKANHSRFIDSSPLIRWGIGSVAHMAIASFASAAIAEAEDAVLFRDYERLTRVAGILSRERLPVELRIIGGYYRGLATLRGGLLEQAHKRLESVAEHGPLIYRAKAFLSLGAIELTQGNTQVAAECYQSASSIAAGKDLSTYYCAERSKAIIPGIHADHRAALRKLEALGPLASKAGKRLAFQGWDYLNSLAVEMNALGRTREALAVIDRITPHPLQNLYPAFRETRESVLNSLPHRSRVRVRLPRADMSAAQNIAEPATVLQFVRPSAPPEGVKLVIFLGDDPNPLVHGMVGPKDEQRVLRLSESIEVL